MEYLYDKLLHYQESDVYPFHMPGHKRQGTDFVNPFLIDITEIDGFDNLHHAEEVLKEAQQRAAALYGAEETHFLVNGSTCGILSAVSACTRKGGKILMARNCHKAAYHAVMMQELDVRYLYPERESDFGLNGGILPEALERILEEEEGIQAVMITSPTYDGVVSDVRRIAEIVHERGIPLIVDEAHGAHFGFHSYFPENSVKLGADIVIHSLHKTLPSLTQTALLHVNGKLADRERLKRYLGIYQSSSPSYVLMAGMDECIRTLRASGEQMFETFAERLKSFRQETEKLSQIRIAGPGIKGRNGIFDFDCSKLVISVKGTGTDGNRLQQILRKKYHLELEMAAGTYALALTSVADSEEGFQRLRQALEEMDPLLERQEGKGEISLTMDDTVTKNEICLRICDALEAPGERVRMEEAEGRISREFLYLYPPGIPLLVPGERISREVLERVEQYRKRGYSLQGIEDYSAKQIQVIRQTGERK